MKIHNWQQLVDKELDERPVPEDKRRTSTQRAVCMQKVKYDSRDTAGTARYNMQKKHPDKTFQVYQCPVCRLWHLTTNTNN